MWTERFDDRLKAEGIAVHDYPLLFMERGYVIFATREAKGPNFSEIVDFWASKGSVYAPDPHNGGWGKFVRTHLPKSAKRRKIRKHNNFFKKNNKQQTKKNGRGWLHK